MNTNWEGNMFWCMFTITTTTATTTSNKNIYICDVIVRLSCNLIEYVTLKLNIYKKQDFFIFMLRHEVSTYGVVNVYSWVFLLAKR